MKVLEIEKMESLSGGNATGAACFGVGLFGVLSIGCPWVWSDLWANRGLIEYCVNS